MTILEEVRKYLFEVDKNTWEEVNKVLLETYSFVLFIW